MKLRKKTLLTIGITLAGLIGVLYAVSSTIVLDGFTKLEKREANRNVQRVLHAFDNYLNQLETLNYQWATWDDTYNFIQDSNQTYIQTNLRPAEFLTLRINAILYINTSGQVVFGQGFNLKEERVLPLAKDLQTQLNANRDLIRNLSQKKRFKGIILLPEGPMVISALPILTSQGNGPSRGTLLMGRYLDDEEIKQLSELTHLNITLYKLNESELPASIKATSTALSQNSEATPITTEPQSKQLMVGYTLLRDMINRQPALLFRVDMPREIYRQGQISLSYFMVSLLVVSVVFAVAILLLLERLVLLRLALLSKEVKSIGSTGDLSMRVFILGEDELAILASTINWMLEALESSLKQLKTEREKAERLLLNILPQPIAERLKKEQLTIAESFAEVTVLFADIVGFTQLASHISPVELVNLLNQIFSAFDQLAEKHGLEKIKTIGDAYMVVGGLPTPRIDHAEAIAEMALDMQQEIVQFSIANNAELSIRIGIHTGPVVAGVIGLKKFIYDLWGDTVNTASRMESHGLPNRIQLSAATYEHLRDQFELEERGAIQVKGKGSMTTYWLLGRKSHNLV